MEKMRETSIAPEPDKTDRRILLRLQRDARITNAELAKALKIRSATCHRRTQRLFDVGLIWLPVTPTFA